MGDFNIPEILRDFIINLINIFVLFIIVKRLVYKPVIKMLNDRKERIAASLEDIQTKVFENNNLKAKYENILKDEALERAKIMAEAEAQGKQHSIEIVAAATVKAEHILKDAEVKNKSAYEKTIKNAKNDISNMVMQVSTKVLQREISDEDNLRIVEEYINS